MTLCVSENEQVRRGVWPMGRMAIGAYGNRGVLPSGRMAIRPYGER